MRKICLRPSQDALPVSSISNAISANDVGLALTRAKFPPKTDPGQDQLALQIIAHTGSVWGCRLSQSGSTSAQSRPGVRQFDPVSRENCTCPQNFFYVTDIARLRNVSECKTIKYCIGFGTLSVHSQSPPKSWRVLSGLQSQSDVAKTRGLGLMRAVFPPKTGPNQAHFSSHTTVSVWRIRWSRSWSASAQSLPVSRRCDCINHENCTSAHSSHFFPSKLSWKCFENCQSNFFLSENSISRFIFVILVKIMISILELHSCTLLPRRFPTFEIQHFAFVDFY